MACPGGCIDGAGHPVPEKVDALEKRQKVLVNIDKTSTYRKSQENPDIIRLYSEFYGEPNSELAHHLLHTHYSQKPGDGICGAINNMSGSAFVSHDLTVCQCESCQKKGSKEVFESAFETIRHQKMDSFVNVKSIRLKETHPGEGIYITFDGKAIQASELESVYKSLKKEVRSEE